MYMCVCILYIYVLKNTYVHTPLCKIAYKN